MPSCIVLPAPTMPLAPETRSDPRSWRTGPKTRRPDRRHRRAACRGGRCRGRCRGRGLRALILSLPWVIWVRPPQETSENGGDAHVARGAAEDQHEAASRASTASSRAFDQDPGEGGALGMAPDQGAAGVVHAWSPVVVAERRAKMASLTANGLWFLNHRHVGSRARPCRSRIFWTAKGRRLGHQRRRGPRTSVLATRRDVDLGPRARARGPSRRW